MADKENKQSVRRYWLVQKFEARENPSLPPPYVLLESERVVGHLLGPQCCANYMQVPCFESVESFCVVFEQTFADAYRWAFPVDAPLPKDVLEYIFDLCEGKAEDYDSRWIAAFWRSGYSSYTTPPRFLLKAGYEKCREVCRFLRLHAGNKSSDPLSRVWQFRVYQVFEGLSALMDAFEEGPMSLPLEYRDFARIKGGDDFPEVPEKMRDYWESSKPCTGDPKPGDPYRSLVWGALRDASQNI